MPDRIPSDHPSIQSHRATVARHGGRRRRLDLPAAVIPTDDAIRVVLDGETRWGIARSGPVGESSTLSGVYASPELAREPEDATNYLAAWLGTHDLEPGGTVLVDVIEPDVAVGLRRPGQRTVYEAIDAPASSLADIASKFADPD